MQRATIRPHQPANALLLERIVCSFQPRAERFRSVRGLDVPAASDGHERRASGASQAARRRMKSCVAAAPWSILDPRSSSILLLLDHVVIHRSGAVLYFYFFNLHRDEPHFVCRMIYFFDRPLHAEFRS